MAKHNGSEGDVGEKNLVIGECDMGLGPDYALQSMEVIYEKNLGLESSRKPGCQFGLGIHPKKKI